MLARYVVRPGSRVIGVAARARSPASPGRLARENAMRNPGRTAVTSARADDRRSALVVFVSVFANGLKAASVEP